MRKYLFEFEDLSWFPDSIRKSMVDYLSFFLLKTNYYKPTIPLIAECLEQANETRIIDLCSGGGGPVIEIQKDLKAYTGAVIPITLTDRFPNISAYKHMEQVSEGRIDFVAEPVDATNIPADLKGLRTSFSALHHFSPAMIKKLISNTVQSKQPIAIFDGGDKNILTVLGIMIGHPLLFIFVTPFLKPFRLSRIIFTYIIPVIPLCTVWDGAVSIARLYRPSELKKLIKETGDDTYVWKTGIVRNKLGFGVSYLIGYPRHKE